VYGSPQRNRGNVIRYCTFTNLFDGAHLYSEDPGGPTEDLDFHSNWLEGCGDDGIETDGVGSNCRIYFNSFQSFLTGVSIAPCARGPTYIFRNLLVGWRPAAEFDGYPFKFNVGSTLPIEWVYLYHNTCATDVPGQDGFLFKQYSNWTNVVSRNNNFAGTRYALESWSTENPVDFDFDNLYSSDPGLAIAWAGARYDSVAGFALATGQERHGRSVAPGFVSPATRDYYLRPDSDLIDQGVVIPGINDDYLGGAPDLGAFEFGMQAQAVSVRGGRLEMDWRVGAPLICQLEYATALDPSAWQSLGEPVSAERSLVRMSDEWPAGSQRFYRLRRVAPWRPLRE
jgi:hypothetical protein